MKPTQALKRVVRRALAEAGLELRRRVTPDLDALYADFPERSLRARAFLNVGAGRFAHPYWTNLDYGSAWYAEHQGAAFVEYDLTAQRPLPYPDESVELVYSSHVIEHVPREASEHFFREAQRVLKPGGALRVTCPDAELLCRSVVEGRLSWWSWREPWFSGPLCSSGGTGPVTLLDYLVREVATTRSRFYVHARDPRPLEELEARFLELERGPFLEWLSAGIRFDPEHPGNHLTWWDAEETLAALRRAGFADPYRSGAGQSLFRPFHQATHFDATCPHMSLYVEAIKSG